MTDWFVSYEMFKNGFMPNGNGWLKESNKYISVMTFISNKLRQHENEQAVKNGRK